MNLREFLADVCAVPVNSDGTTGQWDPNAEIKIQVSNGQTADVVMLSRGDDGTIWVMGQAT